MISSARRAKGKGIGFNSYSVVNRCLLDWIGEENQIR
jgi:hypothetical protein